MHKVFSIKNLKANKKLHKHFFKAGLVRFKGMGIFRDGSTGMESWLVVTGKKSKV